MIVIKKLKYLFFSFFSLLFVTTIHAQKLNSIEINFNPLFQKSSLVKDSNYIIEKDSFQISQCKFYISGVELKNGNKTVYKEKNSFHLINIFDNALCKFNLKIKPELSFNTIQFNLGIDSITNSKGISTGDLDPTKGMYWAWHSGYINFRLEGKSNLCNLKNRNFQFHLGGFRNGFYNMQTVAIKTKKKSRIIIDVDFFNFLNSIDLKKVNHIMTPSNLAVELAKKAITIFSISSKDVQ